MKSETTANSVHTRSIARRNYNRRTIVDAKRWKLKYESGESVLRIAAEDGTDPKMVSSWLHRLGVEFKQGHHRVSQPPLNLPAALAELALGGPEEVLKFLNRSVWGIGMSQSGKIQLAKFCEFVRLHRQSMGVNEIARALSAHRSTIAKWRKGEDQPYLVRMAGAALAQTPPTGLLLLPVHLSSGGEAQSQWVRVPRVIESYEQVGDVVEQLRPLRGAYEMAREFGISESRLNEMRPELMAYLLGMMAGDPGKSGGEQTRFASMNLDLQLTKKQSSNERLGKFVCLCAEGLGIDMSRIRDKQPSGTSSRGKEPSEAFRWSSERSPLLAWMFSVGLGLDWEEKTSNNPIKMDWILPAPRIFKIRFV